MNKSYIELMKAAGWIEIRDRKWFGLHAEYVDPFRPADPRLLALTPEEIRARYPKGEA
jgi:hypothetical protein